MQDVDEETIIEATRETKEETMEKSNVKAVDSLEHHLEDTNIIFSQDYRETG